MDKKNILILASNKDSSNEVFLLQAGGCDVNIISPQQLSQAGWLYRHKNDVTANYVNGSETTPADEIDGVIVRLAAVSPDDLPHIVEADRSYLATEMTAFLLAWLSSLKCPMLNRPTPCCLSGPYLHQAQLIYLVARLGIPVSPCKTIIKPGFESGQQDTNATSRVVIVGEHHLGQVHPRLLSYAKTIARALDVEFVAVDFNGQDEDAEFTGISLWPEINDSLAKLMLDHLSGSIAAADLEGDSICA